MNRGEAWEKFKKSGNINDYLAYRSEMTGKPSDVPSTAVDNILGVRDENTPKWYDNPRSGLWRK